MFASRIGSAICMALGVAWLVGAPTAHAVPQVQGSTGEFSVGGTFALSGADFGPAARIVSWDDFESGTTGQRLGNPVIGPTWTFFKLAAGNVPLTYYSTEQAHSGLKTAKVTWAEPGYSASTVNSFGWTGQGPLYTLYLSYWRYHDPSNLDIRDKNHKQVYTFSNGAADGYTEIQQFIPYMIPAGTATWATYLQNHPGGIWTHSTSYESSTYTWDRWESYVKFENPISANDGYFEAWLNGRRVRQESGLNLCDVENGNYVDDIRIGHMFQGSDTMEYVRSYFDDVYIATSRARIELGNASTFENCTLREIQIPTNWASGNVEFSPRYTSDFSSGSQAWVFVVDENGDASPGFPVTIGQASPTDTTAPVVSIQGPTSADAVQSLSPYVVVSGIASDNAAVTRVEWSNSLGGSGTASGTTAWETAEFVLGFGVNVITIRAYDLAGNVGTDQVSLEYLGPGMPGTPSR
jgi:hypothetical protein